MKRMIILVILGVILVSCTNTKLVQYNTKRLDNIEKYLQERKKGEEPIPQYTPLEREADKWVEGQQ